MFLRRILLLACVMSFTLTLAPRPAMAAVALGVSPVDFQVNIDPGQTYNNAILITNKDTAPVQVSAIAQGFKSDGGNGTVQFDDKIALPSPDLYKITVTPNKFTLTPGQTLQVNFQIKTSTKLPAGGQYVGIVFITIPDNKPGQGVVQQIVSQIGVPILTQISGQLTYSGDIVSFVTDKKTYLNGPVKFTIDFKNTGNIHYPPPGRIEIYRNNQLVDNIPFQGYDILPASSRTIDVTWEPKSMPVGDYTAKALVFTAKNKYEKSASFQVLPGGTYNIARYAIGGLAVLAVIFLLIIILGKRKRKRDTKRR